MKTLLLDIETSPLTVYTWGLWNQNINIKSIVDSGSVLCWAAKWLGDTDVQFMSTKMGHRKMLKKMHKLLDEADCVVHYNGTKFDMPTLNKEFILNGFGPPAPYQQIDLLRTARRSFRFPSNKLDYISQMLGIGSKHEHEGFGLWIKCMKGDKDAWDRMQTYNIQDVVLLEDVYYKFLPWIKGHPNKALIEGKLHSCPHCSSGSMQKRGWSFTQSGKYQRFWCKDCGAWSSSRFSEKVDKEVLKNV